jgi:hypothetical protein
MSTFLSGQREAGVMKMNKYAPRPKRNCDGLRASPEPPDSNRRRYKPSAVNGPIVFDFNFHAFLS